MRDCGPNGIIRVFMNVCFITVAMLILIRDFMPCGMIFMNVCLITVTVVILIGNFRPYVIIFDYVCVTVDFALVSDGHCTSSQMLVYLQKL
jgi:hypothetical protein